MHLDDLFCPSCNQQAEETPMHMLWDCHFALTCWHSITPAKKRCTSVYEEVRLTMAHLPKPIAMEIVMLGCWNIWLQRNGHVFRNIVLQIRIGGSRSNMTFNSSVIKSRTDIHHFLLQQWLAENFRFSNHVS